ncbi:MAG: glycosyltransferase family 2 protein [Deltaproteobacteria bacterium]
MESWRLKTPVALIIFNRPETTTRVFEEIRKAQPPQLLVVADGPRVDHPTDPERCAAARAIIDQVDWDCDIRKNYSEINLGCRRRVSSGLAWVFQEVEEAIILEDDCVPHPTFFRFCEELLEKYRDDGRIGHIGGVNFQFGRRRTDYSYYFSRYNHIWGWASWRRAWEQYDPDMKLWPEIREGRWLLDFLGERRLVAYWWNTFQNVYEGKIDTWDYQWTFHCWIQSRRSILPCVNLISNIGFDTTATHTKGQSAFSNMKTEPMGFPLDHPPYVLRDSVSDRYTETHHYSIKLSLSTVYQGIRYIRKRFMREYQL